MVATAVRLFFSSRPPPGSHPLTVSVAAALVGIGLGTGVLAGLLGVGGGIVMVPALVLLVGASDVVSKGTSLLVIIPTALVGAARNVREGNVDLPVAAMAGLAGVLSAYAGSVLAVHLDPRLPTAVRPAARRGRRPDRPHPAGRQVTRTVTATIRTYDEITAAA